MLLERNNNFAIIRCDETQLDAFCAPDFVQEACEKIRASLAGLKAVILDLSSVEFIDSSGLSAIVLIYQRLKLKILLCGIGEQTGQLIKATRLDSIFSWHRDVHSAMQAA